MGGQDGAGAAKQQTVAVVGTGIAGLSTAWTLAKQGFKVSVFESEDRLGGHAFTYPGDEKTNRPAVDLGFQVFNLTTYPYLTQLFEEIGVAHEPSDMSFALSVNDGETEWASHGLSTVFAQSKNAVSPSFLRMMREVRRFGIEAPSVLKNKEAYEGTTLGEYLTSNGYSKRFLQEYLLPTTAAVWSVPNSQMLEFPVIPLVAFMANHHLLDPLGDRPRWRVVTGRSNQYVLKVEEQLKEMGAEIFLSSPVTAVRKSKAGEECVTVETASKVQTFDHVVMACHSNTSAALLDGEGTKEEKALVSRIRYQPNKIYLHSDLSQMPKTKAAWASWNVLDTNAGPEEKGRDICVTYWLNHLQNLPEDSPLLLCTLNPIGKIDQSKVIYETTLEHPIFDTDAMAAQVEINTQQASGKPRNVWFAGAWLGSGFHEDGIRSAVAIATALSKDAETPPIWAQKVGAPSKPALELIRGPAPEKTWSQALGLKVFKSLAKRGISKGFMHMLLPDGNEMSFGRSTKEEAQAHGEPTVHLRVYDLAMLWKAVSKSDIGLGEAYMNKLFDADDLVALFAVLIVNSQSLRDALNPLGLSANSPIMSLLASVAYAAGNVVNHIRHMARDNTVAGSRKNIEEHYDLGNDMYKLFLDETMTYSCGIHTEEFGAKLAPGQKELPLYESQLAKLDAIIKRADIQPTDHVLEVGCGWGSFAIRAASTTGCRVTGITISTEQLAEAKERVKKAGLEDKVNLIICDYRKMGIEQYNAAKDQMIYEHNLAPGCFDKIVSIEMIEAVGHNHLPEYFETLERMVKPGGRVVVQAISIDDNRYAEYCATSDYIRAMVFPGGHLPCLSSVKWATSETALEIAEVVDIGPDYAITLRMWRENLLAKADEIRELGYPMTWFRNFEMYFAYCEAGFAEKYIYDYHITFVNQSGNKEKQAEKLKSNAVGLEKVFIPVIVALMGWLCAMSFSTDVAFRQTANVLFGGISFASVINLLLPKQDPIMSTVEKRTEHRSKMVMVKLFVSTLVCSVVLGLIASYDLLYTTQLANTAPWESVDSSQVVPNKINATISGELHFCAWNPDSEDQHCNGNDAAPVIEEDQQQQKQQDSAKPKYFMRSPMHFVVGVLAWASCSRFFLQMSLLTGMHAAALVALSILSHSEDTRTATSALGLAIVHGVSELQEVFNCSCALLRHRGYTLSHTWYSLLWKVNLLSLLVIRWVPVPILLFPVILKAPWKVLLPICATAIRETVILANTIGQYKEELDNKVNTQELLVEARTRQELIDAMTQSKKEATSQRSALYTGKVFHHRNKVPGVSDADHKFSYKVWMALVDLSEVKKGTAFADSRWISTDGSSNLFAWKRSNHFGDKHLPLDDCIKSLVEKECGQAPEGDVLVLTNLCCFGYVFNPVSIFYCLNAAGDQLQAVVLEVSNTPWLEKRMYVLPFFDSSPNQDTLQHKWKKDFHVSPFFDVFYNYDWILTPPRETLAVRATSTRRPQAAEQAAKEKETWNHRTGMSPTDADVSDDGARSFYAGLNLSRSESPFSVLVQQPLLTYTVSLAIHVQAFILMFRKGISYKDKPDNAPVLGFKRLAETLYVFFIAGTYHLLALLLWPITKLVKTLFP